MQIDTIPARTRNTWAVSLVIIAALLLAVTPASLWVRNVVFDTEAWVATVGPLADNPDIQDAVAKAASDALITKLDAQKRIADLLPNLFGLDKLAPVLASTLEDAIRSQATNVVRSEEFGEIWRDINRASHSAVLAAVMGGERGAASLEDGTLTLDTGVIIDQVKKRLEDRGLGFIVKAPTSTMDRQIVLMQSDTLKSVAAWAKVVRAIAYAIPLFGVLLLAGGVWFAADRQRVAVVFGAALALFGILPAQMVYITQVSASRSIERLAGIPTAAAEAAFDIIFRDVIASDRYVIYAGLAILLVALVAGPYRWAVTLRASVVRALHGDSAV
ncbi:MAG TPA: hypothetical protein VFG89_06220 [Coriobacteriia bacterium]|nr:hypothetical protein [Coriobacteriia bacterium]